MNTFKQYIEGVPTKEQQFNACDSNGEILEFLKDRSVGCELAACYNYGKAIKFVKDPNLPMKIFSYKNDSDNIRLIHNPYTFMIIDKISKDYEYIKEIDNPSDVVILHALITNPKSITHIRNLTKEHMWFYLIHYHRITNHPELIYENSINMLSLLENSDNTYYTGIFFKKLKIKFYKFIMKIV